MNEQLIKQNLENIFSEIQHGNNLGEPVTLVGATKTIDADAINYAVSLGLKVVAENKAQEFRDKFELVKGADYQFIGHLQSNKVKYVVGKASIIQSVDCFEIAEVIGKEAEKRNVVQDVLAEINVGGELSKSGFNPDNAIECVKKLSLINRVRVVGLMAMLPKSDDEELLSSLTEKMRSIYDVLKSEGLPFRYLSVGMSEDYKVAIKHGSNMIRIGSAIFGKRPAGVTSNDDETGGN